MKIKQLTKHPLILMLCLLFIGGVFMICMNSYDNAREALSPEKAAAEQPWNLMLVNAENAIPKDYEPMLVTLSNGEQVEERILPQLQKMFDDARADGIQLYVREGYRTKNEQRAMMAVKIKSLLDSGDSMPQAVKKAKLLVAAPGHSEHETGLAVDINNLPPTTADELYAWLELHAASYGFILRYPQGKTDETGIAFEPWHYRYVGAKAAEKITKEGMTLEEYLEKNNR